MTTSERTTGPASKTERLTPDAVADLPRPRFKEAARRARAEFKRHHLTDLAAALTYYGVLAVIPGLIVLVAVLGLLGPDATNEVTNQVQQLAPGSSAQLVQNLIQQAQSNRTGAGIGAILGLVIALWSASGYVAAFMRASNVIYDIGEGRPIWKTVPIRLGVTVLAVVVLVISVVVVVVSGPVARQIGDLLGAGDTTVLLWGILKWPVMLILLSILLAVMFWASPNAKQGGVKWVSPGGLIAVLIWVAASAVFALYVTVFASYDKTYGSMAGVVIFLVWMWLSNIALLLGAEINAEIDHNRAIAAGIPAEVQPFAEPRDTAKLAEEEKRALEPAERHRQAHQDKTEPESSDAH